MLLLSNFQHIVIVVLYMYMIGEPGRHIGMISTFVWVWKTFPGRWLRHWPKTVYADPEQIAGEPAHRITQNTMFCGTKCKGGICLYVYSSCPQLHFPTVWRRSKRGLLTITCHTLDVFSVLKRSFKQLFRVMENLRHNVLRGNQKLGELE